MIKREITKRDHRVAVLEDTLARMLRVIEARAELLKDDEQSGGGDTGLIVKTERPGKFGTTVEYELTRRSWRRFATR